MTRVAIVILNWNGFADTEQSVISMLKQSYGNFSVVVVENGSTDGSAQKLRSLQKHLNDDRLTILNNEKNLGFAGGVNTGIRYALENSFDAVALFNNDAVADAQWLASLVDASEKHNTSVVTGLLLHEDGTTIDSTGDFYTTWGMPFPRSRGTARGKAPVSGFVFGATGGATLYKREVFERVGLFDERFFAYYEDVDISFRAQLAGMKIYYTDKAIAYHKQGATSSKIPGFTVYQTFKNIPMLFIKNVPAGLLLPVGARLCLLYILIFGNAVKNGNGWYALRGWLASVWHFWSNSLWQRFTIQRNKIVLTDYIRSIIYPDIPPEQTGLRAFRKIFTRKP